MGDKRSAPKCSGFNENIRTSVQRKQLHAIMDDNDYVRMGIQENQHCQT
jgi:hypothetical protein